MSKMFPKKQFSISCPHTSEGMNEWKKKLKNKKINQKLARNPVLGQQFESCIPKPASLSDFICLQGFIYHLLLTSFSHLCPCCCCFLPPFNHTSFRGSQTFNLGWLTIFKHLAWQKWILFFCNHALHFPFLCYSDEHHSVFYPHGSNTLVRSVLTVLSSAWR